MGNFPTSVYAPRTIANRTGVVYDADNTKTLYAEDLNKTNDEVVAIENALGLNPKGIFASVKAWLTSLSKGYQVRCRVSLGTNQANIGTSYVTVNLDSEQYDTGGDFNSTTHRFTAPVSGYYQINASAYLYDIIADQESLNMRIYKNNSTIVSRNQLIASKANTGHTIKTSDCIYLAEDDYIEMQVQVPISSNCDIYNSSALTYLSIHLISLP